MKLRTWKAARAAAQIEANKTGFTRYIFPDWNGTFAIEPTYPKSGVQFETVLPITPLRCALNKACGNI